MARRAQAGQLTPRTVLSIAKWRGAGGVELVGETAGDAAGPTVVLMHGGGQTRHAWAGSIAPLCDAGYGVVNFDLRGHGDSGWATDGDYSLAAMAADLRAVVATVQGPSVWVGASLGGITALRALLDTPRPEALVLVDIVLEPEAQGVERIRRFMNAAPSGFASLEDAAAAVAAYNPHRRRPPDPSGLLKNLRLRADGRYHWHWDPKIVRDDAQRFNREMAQLAGGLHGLTLPVLLVRGASSDVVGEAGVAALRALLPQVEVRDVAAAGHMVAGDSNGAFGAALLEFLLRRLPRSAAGSGKLIQ